MTKPSCCLVHQWVSPQEDCPPPIDNGIDFFDYARESLKLKLAMRMKPHALASLCVLGSFALLGSAPAFGALILWTAPPRSEPLIGYYLIFTAPLGMLGWAIITINGLHRSESRLLAALSVINTVLLYADLVGCFGLVGFSCISGLKNVFPPAYSH